MRRWSVLLLAALGGCGMAGGDPATAPEENVAAAQAEQPRAEAGPVAVATPSYAGWVGRWVGPEGLYLDIAEADAPDRYRVTVNLLDGAETYEGVAEAGGIRIDRGPEGALVRKATGDETGLKYLAGKTNCLMIATAEGFCRD